MPPTKPTLPDLLASAASTPTRYEPSCSLNTIDCTFGRSTTESMMTKRMLGNSGATFLIADSWLKPMPMIGSAPRCAILRNACSRCASACTSNSQVAGAGFLLELLDAVIGGFVERLVELAAGVIDDRRVRHRRRRGKAECASGKGRLHQRLHEQSPVFCLRPDWRRPHPFRPIVVTQNSGLCHHFGAPMENQVY